MARPTDEGGRIWAGAVALVLLMVAVFAWNLKRTYDEAVAEEWRDQESLARIADEHISGSLRGIDHLLMDVAAAIGREADILGYMKTRAKAFPEVRTVFFVDEGGTIVEGTFPAQKGLDVRDRSYYREYLAAPGDARLRVSKPVTARPTGVVVFFASKALTGDNGGLRGVVAVSLEISYFNEILKSVLPAGESSVILVDWDGDVLARATEAEKYVGRNFASGQHFGGHVRSGRKVSYNRAVAATDGEDRFSVARTVSYSPLVVIVSRTAGDALASWRKGAVVSSLSLAGLVLATLVLTFLMRSHQRGLLAAKEFTDQIIETANVMVVGLDREGRIELLNEAAEELTGYRRGELLGRDWFELVVPRSRFPEVWETFVRFRDDEVIPRTFENPIVAKDGDERLISWQNSAIRKDGRVIATVSFGIDVTERKIAAESLRRSLDELTRANTELERFAFVASHDLQEPLRNIVAYSQKVERDLGERLAPETQENFHIVIEAAQRMRALVGDLLVYSRTLGRLEPFRRFPMEEAASAALANLREAIDEAGASVAVANLPEIEGDRVQIVMLLQNLVANAVKYRRPDVSCRVEIGGEVRGGRWVFHVRDNGIGIEPAYWDRIFEAFRRLHPADAYPGTGIGLAICRQIVGRHGGRIWVESEAGKGSCFFFTLDGGK
jgi:PAS domain S-box-containing protein